MGCAQSKVENEEAVSRCKERRAHMKQSVASRNAFAAAHSSYVKALKDTGAALNEFAQAEIAGNPNSNPNPNLSSVPTPVQPHTPIDSLPPPPPPLPDFSPSPLQRAVTMPESVIVERRNPNPNVNPKVVVEENRTPPPPPPPVGKGMTWDYFFSMEESGNVVVVEEEEGEMTPPVTPVNVTPENVTPEKVTPEKVRVDKMTVGQQGSVVHHQHAASMGVLEVRRGKGGGGSGNVLQILCEIDDHFLKASETAQEVSKMLEATRLHYHSNFADNRGHIDHSARVMQIITWNRSFKGIASADKGQDDFDNDEWDTHATILDKLLAWEKKLYDEVKAGELMKIEYQRKVTLLNKQKKRNSSLETLEKTKAAVSHLHTRYIVDMQSMDSTVSEIQHLQDNQLYPKLSALVEGMAQMWENMHIHHGSQLKLVVDLRGVDIPCNLMETSDQHFERTAQLHRIASEWHSEFQKLVNHQKEYIQALNNWLKLNLIPIESSLREKVSSPPRVQQPPIQALLHAWHDQLERLPNDLAKSAMNSFTAVISAIMVHQQEELKQKEKCEEARREYMRKDRAFVDWYNKYTARRAGLDEADAEQTDPVNHKDPVAERQFVVEALKKKAEEEEEGYRTLCKQVREKSVASLKTHLPELFRAMADFSLHCSIMYKNLRTITQMQNQSSS